MTILTIDEAAGLLRVSKRTLYRLREIPRVRIGHRVMFLHEDVEAWVRSRSEGECGEKQPIETVDHAKSTGYHRNPLFVLPRGLSVDEYSPGKDISWNAFCAHLLVSRRPVSPGPGARPHHRSRKESANRIISAIHHTYESAGHRSSIETNEARTFEEFLPTYFQYLKAKRRDADKRNEIALRLHLVPFFGQKPLRDIRLEDGLAYLEQRQAEGAAEGTVERECAVLMAILNLAVDFEALDRNRLRRLPVPSGSKRERILDASDLHQTEKGIVRTSMACHYGRSSDRSSCEQAH